MSFNQHCWSLSSLLLLLAGRNLGVLVKIHQPSVYGIVGQSVLLPVSYKLGDSLFPVSIVWEFFRNHSAITVSCTVMNCTMDAGEVPYNCFSCCIPSPRYHNHSKVFPENGSLLLQHLQLNDSGTYKVTFRPPHQAYIIDLTVHEQPPPCQQPAGPVGPDFSQYLVIGICSSVSLLLLLLPFCCLRCRGAVWQKRRIVKVQQVLGVEKAHMESSVVADTVTIYATVEGSMEQAPPRPTPEVVYTSVSSPHLRGRDPGPCHLLI